MIWLKGFIGKLPKKGNLKECTNWRGITLLVIASKVLGKILIGRLKSGVDKRLRAEQAGFRQGRNTTNKSSSCATLSSSRMSGKPL